MVFSLISTAILLASTFCSVSAIPTRNYEISRRADDAANKKPHTVIYFGQSLNVDEEGKPRPLIKLGEFCEKDTFIDTIVIGFVTDFINEKFPYPTTNFAGYGNGVDEKTGIHMVPEWETEIPACQQKGKRVLISIGGASGRQNPPKEPEKVKEFAGYMAKMFGKDMSDPSIRPFGSAVVDGIDWDIEGEFDKPRKAENWEGVIKAAKEAMPGAVMAAAPQCPPPHATEGDLMMGKGVDLVDEVYLQLYNNAAAKCEGENAVKGLKAWSEYLAKNAPTATLYAGFPGSDSKKQSAGSGYLPHDDMIKTVQAAFTEMPNFNGVMAWEVTTAALNMDKNNRSFLGAMFDAVGTKGTPVDTPVPSGTTRPIPTGTGVTVPGPTGTGTGSADVLKKAHDLISEAVLKAGLRVDENLINGFIGELTKTI